jgi:hypothetical protein
MLHTDEALEIGVDRFPLEKGSTNSTVRTSTDGRAVSEPVATGAQVLR